MLLHAKYMRQVEHESECANNVVLKHAVKRRSIRVINANEQLTRLDMATDDNIPLIIALINPATTPI